MSRPRYTQPVCRCCCCSERWNDGFIWDGREFFSWTHFSEDKLSRIYRQGGVSSSRRWISYTYMRSRLRKMMLKRAHDLKYFREHWFEWLYECSRKYWFLVRVISRVSHRGCLCVCARRASERRDFSYMMPFESFWCSGFSIFQKARVYAARSFQYFWG